jgi:large subunit ribosomal protein L6
MSRIGSKPVKVPNNVEVSIKGEEFFAKGPKGQASLVIHRVVKVDQKDKEIIVEVKNHEEIEQKALWGTFRMLIANLIEGVEKGYEKRLEINGTGYKAAISGKKLVMELGYSHPVELEILEGLEVKVDKNIIIVSGIDKQLVGEFSARIRSKRKVEPYKGKGIRYVNEYVRRKVGKKAVGEGE